MYGPVVSLEKVMSAICGGRFKPEAPRSQYWRTVLPVCRTPRATDFQGPGVVPMTPKVNIEHQILGKQAKEAPAPPEEAVAVKQEDGWGLVAPDPDLTTDVVVEVSSSSESESSVSEMSLLSDDGDKQSRRPMRSGSSIRRLKSFMLRQFMMMEELIVDDIPIFTRVLKKCLSFCSISVLRKYAKVLLVNWFAAILKTSKCVALRCKQSANQTNQLVVLVELLFIYIYI